MFKQVCTYCGENFWRCRCDSFHPSVNVDTSFKLSFEEVINLQKYFHSAAGYISHEFHQPVHDILKRMDDYVNGRKTT